MIYVRKCIAPSVHAVKFLCVDTKGAMVFDSKPQWIAAKVHEGTITPSKSRKDMLYVCADKGFVEAEAGDYVVLDFGQLAVMHPEAFHAIYERGRVEDVNEVPNI